MSNQSKDNQQHANEVEALRSRVDALAEKVKKERDARKTCEALLGRAADGAFAARVDRDGRILDVWPDEQMPVQQHALTSLLASDPVPAHCRHVLNTGQATRFLIESSVAGGPALLEGEEHAGADSNGAPASDEVWDVTLARMSKSEARSFFERSASSESSTGPSLDAAATPTAENRNGEPAPAEEEGTGKDAAGGRNGLFIRGMIRTANAEAGSRVLRESHALQHELVEMLSDAILIVGSDDRVLFTNRAALEMVGASTDEDVLGANIWTFVHPGSRSLTRDWKRRIRRGVPVDFAEHKLKRLDGTSRPVETASVPIVYQGQRAALVAVRDRAGQQRMAETIQRTLDLFDKAFHLGPSALLIVRLRDGVIMEVSDRMVEFSGQDARELLGQNVERAGIHLESTSLQALAGDLMDTGSMRDREIEVTLPDGSMRSVLLSARLTEIDEAMCALVSLVDITERKRAAVAVRESQTLLDKIFRASPAPIAICDLETWEYIDANEAMCGLVGLPHDEIVGHTPGDLDLWVDPSVEEDLSRQLEENDAVYDVEAAFRTSSGDIVKTLASFQQISVDGTDCVLAVMTDITQREEAKQALIEAKDRAEEIAQFRSTVLSNMTHEVRTPLTVILGFTSILSEGVTEDYRRFVSLIERSGRRLLLTLDSLLDLAQLEAGTLDPDMEIQSVADAVNGMTSSHVSVVEEKGLSFSLDVPDKHVFAEFDYELLGRVLTHLIDNAMKFTDNGAISVHVEPTEDTVTVCVQDTGSGISEAFQDRIFDAFSQESEGNTRSHQGSGLGLTVSKRIVECMGGELQIDSKKGEGTRVSVCLPQVKVEG